MDRFRYNLKGGGLQKHPEGNLILLVDHENEIKKYEEPGQECNSGHKNTLPVKLWDCPVCTELLREKNKKLLKAIEGMYNMVIYANERPVISKNCQTMLDTKKLLEEK